MVSSPRPPIALLCQRFGQRDQHSVTVAHHFLVREPQSPATGRAQQPGIAQPVPAGIMSIAIKFDHQALGRTEKIDNPVADNSLPPKLVSGEPAAPQFHPQLALRFGQVPAHGSGAAQEELARDATTPNPLL